METIPAAQYLRVSTERQEYSLGCQSAGIANYPSNASMASMSARPTVMKPKVVWRLPEDQACPISRQAFLPP